VTCVKALPVCALEALSCARLWDGAGKLGVGVVCLQVKTSVSFLDKAAVQESVPFLLTAPLLSDLPRAFSRLNSPRSLSLSSYERCSIPWIICVALLWSHPDRSVSLLYWGLPIWMQYCRWGLTLQSRGAGSPPPPCWPCCFWCSPGYSWISGLRGHSAGSCPAAIHSTPRLFIRAVLCPYIPRCKTSHSALLNLMRFTWAHCSSLSMSPWITTHPSGMLTTAQFGIIHKLAVIFIRFCCCHSVVALLLCSLSDSCDVMWCSGVAEGLSPCLPPSAPTPRAPTAQSRMWATRNMCASCRAVEPRALAQGGHSQKRKAAGWACTDSHWGQCRLRKYSEVLKGFPQLEFSG